MKRYRTFRVEEIDWADRFLERYWNSVDGLVTRVDKFLNGFKETLKRKEKVANFFQTSATTGTTILTGFVLFAQLFAQRESAVIGTTGLVHQQEMSNLQNLNAQLTTASAIRAGALTPDGKTVMGVNGRPLRPASSYVPPIAPAVSAITGVLQNTIYDEGAPGTAQLVGGGRRDPHITVTRHRRLESETPQEAQLLA